MNLWEKILQASGLPECRSIRDHLCAAIGGPISVFIRPPITGLVSKNMPITGSIHKLKTVTGLVQKIVPIKGEIKKIEPITNSITNKKVTGQIKKC